MKASGIRRLFRFPSKSVREVRDDVRDEVRFHLEMRTRDLEAEGLDAAAAREQALREFGDVSRASDTLVKLVGRVNRERGLSRLAAELQQDVSYGLRLIGRNKGFSGTAIVTLALAGGGAAVARGTGSGGAGRGGLRGAGSAGTLGWSSQASRMVVGRPARDAVERKVQGD
jgi:hypothetical protein